jgi:hypothetical protein
VVVTCRYLMTERTDSRVQALFSSKYLKISQSLIGPGKTNFWIRARLVGGDYGHAEVKVVTKPGANPGETVQTVRRSTDNIKAPQILDLSISYQNLQRNITYVRSRARQWVNTRSRATRTAHPVHLSKRSFRSTSCWARWLTLHLHRNQPECPPQCTCGNHAK